jgi:magnesium-transporting ATPase (P-type)
LIIFIVWIAIALVFGVFWLWMLIHAATHPIQNRALWIVVIVFFNIVGAIVYYFAVKRGFDRMAKLAPTASPAMGSASSGMASPLAAPVSPQISDYVRTSRQQGIADDAIRQALIGSGWNANDVDRAMHL